MTARSGANGRTNGFTLLELMLVIGLIGVIAGVGLGMFATFDPGRRTAVGLVQNVLRQAHHSAIARRAPTAVRIDRETGIFVAEAMEVAGTWHFESDELEGGRGIDGTAFDFERGALTEDGYTGRALDLTRGGRRPRVEVDLLSDPLLDPRRGFALELALRPTQLAGGRVVDVGGVVMLNTKTDGSVEGRIITRRVDEVGRDQAGPPVTVRSGGGVLRPGRWVRVRLVYDRRTLSLFADGVPLASTVETRELWNIARALVLGDAQQAWPGALDQVVLATVSASDEHRLPFSVRFAPSTPSVVRFLPGGSLDPTTHAGAVRIRLLFDDGTEDEVRINGFGTIE